MALLKGDLILAEQRFRESLECGRGWLWTDARAEILRDLACIAWARGEAAAAIGTLIEALRMVHEFRAPAIFAECLAVLASMVALTGDAEGAAPLLAASEAIRRYLDPDAKPLDQAFNPVASRLCAEGLAAVASALSPDLRERRWQEGAAMDLDTAARAALGLAATGQEGRSDA